ncbi:MAG: hypothetical protein KDA61_13395, partial [Planctomycetales bacterium]|nr:hypothetical protein [Planctomycetales bacterium]
AGFAVAPCGAWPAAAPPAPAGAPAAPGFFQRVGLALHRAHLRCQQSVAGKLVANMVKPVSRLTGGLIPACPDNEFAAAVELQAGGAPATGPGGEPLPPPPPPPSVAAAAKIKAEQAEAQLRRDAVAFLAGVDCRYYPEAEAALIASLRADRSECVRMEAAKSLLHCGCCTPAIIAALKICVEGSEADGNPAECSPRVRQIAARALIQCQCRCAASGGALPRPEAPLAAVAQTASPASFETNESAHSAPAPRRDSLWQIWQAAGRRSTDDAPTFEAPTADETSEPALR